MVTLTNTQTDIHTHLGLKQLELGTVTRPSIKQMKLCPPDAAAAIDISDPLLCFQGLKPTTRLLDEQDDTLKALSPVIGLPDFEEQMRHFSMVNPPPPPCPAVR